MNFNFFKKKERHEELTPSNGSSNDFKTSLPEIYRGMQVYESESDRFCTFDEDYFFGESYDLKQKNKKRKIIPPPKTPPSFFMGILCGTASVLLISGLITFLTLFSKSGGIYRSVTVPDLTSLTEDEAIALIEKERSYLDCKIQYKENPNVKEGSVISQIPKPSTTRKLYGINGRITVKLTVCKPAEKLTLPNLIGQNAREVLLKLQNAGINVSLSEEYSDTVKVGKIISSSHPEGSLLQKNDTVYITASLGKKYALVNVPNLLGMSEVEAIEKLKKENLEVNKVIYKSSELPLGTVIEQSIEPQASVKERSKITLFVSKGSAVE